MTIGILFLPAASARAGGLPLDPSQLSNPQALIDSYANVLVKTVGFSTDHRDFEPATALGVNIGVDLSIELSLVKVSQEFNDALNSTGGSANIPVLPVPKLNAHKSLGPRVDLGGSFISFQGYLIWGGSLKTVLWQAEEGLTWALRGTFSKSKMGIVKTTNYGIQLLTSRRLDFADPYLGAGYQITNGTLSVEGIPDPTLENPFNTRTLTGNGNGSAYMAFIGVGLKVPNLGLKVTLQGEYSSVEAHSLGTKVGFSF
jgi:hypothetical protein